MPRRTRASAPPKPPKPAPGHTVSPHPAWGVALIFAKGDHRRLRVMDASTVLVCNNPPRDKP